MAYYDEQGFSRMQRDALERMRDMQKRSKSLVFEAPPPKPEEKESKPTDNQSALPEHGHNQSHSNKQTSKPNDIISSAFSGLGNIDTEKLLILLLLYILYKNKADFKLILALGYLLI